VFRLLALCLCGALGVGVAICLATSSEEIASSIETVAEQIVDAEEPQEDSETTSPDPTPAAAAQVIAEAAAPEPPAAPVTVEAQPAFTQQSIPPANDALINRLEQAIGNMNTQAAERQETLGKTLEALKNVTGLDESK